MNDDIAASAGPTGPLDGLRVIELGSLLAGPYAGRLLGDMGAEVIKIESPDNPDPLREWGQALYRGRSLWWPIQSRNKKCCTLDLRSKEGREVLLSLVEVSDVLLENFRPGTLEKWGIGPDILHSVNERLVVCRVSGYGQTGPYSRRAGFASVAEAMGGLRYINGYPDQPPPRIHISLGDTLAGMIACQGILAGLYRRNEPTGTGQTIDVSLLEASFSMLECMVPEYDRLGVVRGPGGTALKGVAPSNIFRTVDQKWIVIAANADGPFRRLCEAMAKPELAVDPRFATHLARGANEDEIHDIVGEWAKSRTSEDIDRQLNDAGVVCGPIYTIADIVEDEHFIARDMLLTHSDPELGEMLGPGIIPKFSDTPGAVRWTGTWTPGSHNSEIYGGVLGMSEDRLTALKSSGVI